MTQGSNYYCMDKTNSVESPLTNNHMVASSCNSESNSSAMVCSGANNCLVCSICSPSYTSAYPSPCSMASSDCCSYQLLARTSHASSYSCSNPMVCSSDLCTHSSTKSSNSSTLCSTSNLCTNQLTRISTCLHPSILLILLCCISTYIECHSSSECPIMS